jgi:sulfate adenylyltransferase subunit 1 (EFTu-like GTPase family)
MPSKEKYKIWWDDKKMIVKGQVFGVIDEKAAQGILNEVIFLSNNNENNIEWLVDLRQMTKVTSKARKILADATGHSSINKIAFSGASTFVRTIVNIISRASGQKNARHFHSEKAALLWLKDEDQNA